MCSSEQGFHWNGMRQDSSCLLTANSAPPSSSILLIPDNLFSLIWFTHWFCPTFPPPLLATPSGIFSCRDGNLVVSLEAQTVKNPPAVQEPRVWSLDWEDPLEEGMVTHSSMLSWRAWTEDSGGLQSMGWKELDTIEQQSTAQRWRQGKEQQAFFSWLQNHCRWRLQPWN